MKGKQFNWNEVKIMLNGVEMHHVSGLVYTPSIHQLRVKLKEAEENEDYELCIKLKGKIDNYKKEL